MAATISSMAVMLKHDQRTIVAGYSSRRHKISTIPNGLVGVQREHK
jgi:hypothetical protein